LLTTAPSTPPFRPLIVLRAVKVSQNVIREMASHTAAGPTL
jgi:hypothetical protein